MLKSIDALKISVDVETVPSSLVQTEHVGVALRMEATHVYIESHLEVTEKMIENPILSSLTVAQASLRIEGVFDLAK